MEKFYRFFKLKSLIYGLAVGDAIGVPVEFKNRDYLKKHPIEGMTEFGTYNQPIGTWSDDTSLTLCLLDSIDFENNLINKELLKNNILDWYDKAGFTATGIRFDIGFTTAKSIKNLKYGYDIYNCGIEDERSNGNGALMRISPLINLTLDMDPFVRYTILRDIVSITHGHEINIVGCHFYLEFMINVFKYENLSKDEILDKTIQYLNDFYINTDLEEYYIYYSRIYNKEIFKKKFLGYDDSIIKSSGYIVDSLEASIFCFMTSNSYKESVLKAVNLGEDTDTIAAITGTMSALYYGFESIPEKWINQLKNKELIENILKEKKKSF